MFEVKRKSVLNMDPKVKTNQTSSEYGSNQEQSPLTTECASESVSTHSFYNVKSFDMHIMKNSMHSRIDTKTMDQVHCLNKRYYCGDQFFQVFWCMARGTWDYNET